ncbi:MAG: hypothetical protein QY326_05520 [Bdellovibrionota bacterium]|nr:MAG: hypothetical protein QY326_05520 [Bdellovibrionota bacterium]
MFRILLVASLCLLSGCFTIPMGTDYAGPEAMPAELAAYYSQGSSYQRFREVPIEDEKDFVIKRITIESEFGTASVDYFEQKYRTSDELILVFPVLGGKNTIAHYFADYFARNGYDTAIVQRNEEFKNPDNFDQIEEVLRKNVVRDRVVLDLFEREYGKKKFGSLGLSRGAINVAITAGADPRLRYNVLALGGSDLPAMFRDSNQRRIQKYIHYVSEKKNISSDQVIELLREEIRTDPKYLARYIDGRDTLMILSLFDRTVPVKYGRKLRRQLGYPKTIFLPADHYVALLYTGLIKMAVSDDPAARGPFSGAFVESEALDFFNEKFDRRRTLYRKYIRPVLHLPLDLVGQTADALF